MGTLIEKEESKCKGFLLDIAVSLLKRENLIVLKKFQL
jgi:hypothetical protein